MAELIGRGPSLGYAREFADDLTNKEHLVQPHDPCIAKGSKKEPDNKVHQGMDWLQEIFEYLVENERKYLPSCDYLRDLQDDITEHMRAILIDWLIDVHRKFRLRDETLYLTVNFVDRYLSRKRVDRQSLQLVGVVSMWVASKYEEVYPPQLGDFVYITDNVDCDN